MAYCCAKLRKAIKDGKVRFDGQQWHTVSSSVYMLTGLLFCPWCSKALPPAPVIPAKKYPLYE
jgi:hypothetical protein